VKFVIPLLVACALAGCQFDPAGVDPNTPDADANAPNLAQPRQPARPPKRALHLVLGDQGADVVAYLEQAFQEHCPPLVLKQDRGSNLNSEPVLKLCDRYGVIILNSPAGYPPYNGRRERANRYMVELARSFDLGVTTNQS
jgi:hypothetical protein